MKFFISIGAFVVIVATGATGATWYVDNTAVGANYGTSWANAWTDVSRINAASGDTVYFSGGAVSQTYQVSQWTPPSGTAGNPINYQVGQDAAHDGIVVFSGTGGGDTFIKAKNGVTLRNVVFNGGIAGGTNMVVTNYGKAVDTDGANGMVLRYMTLYAPIELSRGATRYEIDHCRLLMSSGADHAISLGTPDAASGYDLNGIHDCYIEVARTNDAGTTGDAGIQHGQNLSIYGNYFKAVAVANYRGAQRCEAVQADGSYIRIWGNIFENFASCCTYIDYTGGNDHVTVNDNTCFLSDPVLKAAQPGVICPMIEKWAPTAPGIPLSPSGLRMAK